MYTNTHMTGFNHTLAGAIIAVVIPSPYQPLTAFLSHFLLDVFPHFGNHDSIKPWNDKFKKMLLADGVVSLLILIGAIALFPDRVWLIFTCIVASTLPDYLWWFEDKAPQWMRPYYAFHLKIQWEVPHGGWYECVYFVIGIGILLFLAI